MQVTMAQALNQSLSDAMEKDERVIVFGEDVGKLGGVFRITDKLQDRFGSDRCFDTPLAESGIVGVALGLAFHGFRPVAEIQFDGFVYPAFEQIVTHVAKYRNRTRGKVSLPLTIRLPYGGGIGAVEHHSESPETYWMHTAGLKIFTPGLVSDAYSLLQEAIWSDDPVIFMEPKRRYWTREEVDLPIETERSGRAVVRREGTTATILAYGPMVLTALEAATAGVEQGWELEVVDLRSLNPLDENTIYDSVKKTGRCVVVHEAPMTLGPGAEFAARIQEECFYSLEAPVLRAVGFDTPYPPARLEKYWLPDADRILDCVERSLTAYP